MSEVSSASSASSGSSNSSLSGEGFGGDASGPLDNNNIASQVTELESLLQSQTTEEQLRSQNTNVNTLQQRTATDSAVDITTTAAAANVGFNAPLTGIHIGNAQLVAPSMQFGRYSPDSLSPSSGYNITQFSRTDSFAGHISRQTMVSSQAAFEYAKSIDPSLSNTSFEVPNANGRSYDIQINDDLVEIKAGKSISSPQLARDIDLAKTGQAVDYVFAGNSITGNHGPDASVANRLADATQRTSGNLTSTVADIAPSSSQVDAVVSASRFSSVAKGAGKVLGPAGVALDVYTIGNAVRKDGGTFGENTKVAVSETAGGWAGATSMGYAGAKGGAIGGSWLGNKISGWF